jgi:hypothetical protein
MLFILFQNDVNKKMFWLFQKLNLIQSNNNQDNRQWQIIQDQLYLEQ